MSEFSPFPTAVLSVAAIGALTLSGCSKEPQYDAWIGCDRAVIGSGDNIISAAEKRRDELTEAEGIEPSHTKIHISQEKLQQARGQIDSAYEVVYGYVPNYLQTPTEFGFCIKGNGLLRIQRSEPIDVKNYRLMYNKEAKEWEIVGNRPKKTQP